MPPATAVFFNKSGNIGPYVSYPYRPEKKSLLETIRSALIAIPVVDTHGRKIDLAPWPERIDADGVVHFRDNGRPEYERMRRETVRPDVVVLCTGYKQVFPFFDHDSNNDDNKNATRNGTKSAPSPPPRPYPTASDADVRNIWRRDDPTVAFMGFVRPSLGAIPPLSEMQAQLWVLHLVTALDPTIDPSLRPPPRPLLPRDEPHYRLLHAPGSRVGYGVDHESYAYQLALDMDSAAGFVEVVRLGWAAAGGLRSGHGAWRLPVVWALGANFNAKFRLRGPWRWDGAVDVLVDELWLTVARRGVFFGEFWFRDILPGSLC